VQTVVRLAVLALVATAAPAMAQNGGGNKAAHDWNTGAFAKTPDANTNAFAKTPDANTKAFARTPPANTHALGTEHGGKVTAFGNGGETTNAFGNHVTATHNAHRMANSFGTGTDHNPSPVGPSARQGTASGQGR
jgi:hypothetical protein